MDAFKYAIFSLELATLPEEQRIVEQVEGHFKRLRLAQETLFQRASSLEEAAALIDDFKAKTCGSAYNVALINLNLMSSPEELAFLLGGPVLGDPRTIFMVTLRGIHGPTYAIARDKVEREADLIMQGQRQGAPSCVDSYTAAGRPESAQRIAEILNAFLEEEEERVKSRQTGVYVPHTFSKAHDLMRRTTTIFCGHRQHSKTGILSRGDAGASSSQNRRISGRMGPVR
ncbi:MAG: hypothetical protein KIS92_22940 [Planctomycetota bacterium]|nr:hypothetical protein [Planctomycetota bacterium]